MMKHIWKTGSCLLLILTLMLCLLTSCGGADGNTSFDSMVESDGYFSDDAFKEDIVSSENTTVTDNRKIIETSELTVETKTFDELIDGLYAQIAALGGYVESSDVSGNAIDSDRNRYASMTVRIPSDKSDEFTAYVSENSVVTRRYVTTDDVTLQYVDMESRLSALETERASLEALLASAATVEDIITVRDRLTDVIGEIESYTAQLRTLDNLVSFATIKLSVYEVEKTAVVEEQTAWTRIADGFVENLKAVGDGFVEFFVWAISSLPLLIPIAIFVAVVVLIVNLLRRASKKKKRQAMPPMPPQNTPPTDGQ